MQTSVDEIADRIYRISTYIPEVAAPAGFTFNQFLIDDEDPLLFHTGHRQMFPVVADAVTHVTSVERLRWITFGHLEADECGAMNQWLTAAARAEVFFGELGCEISFNDLSDRPPVAIADGAVVELGDKRVRRIDTPHVPHNWESQVLFEETTGTLFAGDLFTHAGRGDALTEHDVVEPAAATEDVFHANSLSAHAGATIRGLASLAPRTLAIMHGSSFSGDCVAALHDLADDCDRRILEVLERGLAGRPGRGCPDPTAHHDSGTDT